MESYKALLATIGCSKGEKRFIDDTIKYLESKHLYDGNSLDGAINAMAVRLDNIPYLEEFEYLKQEVYKASCKFYYNAYKHMCTFREGFPEDQQDNCKKRSKEILELFSLIVQTDQSAELVIETYNDKVYDLEDLKYFPSGRFTVKQFYEELGLIDDVYIHHGDPRYFRGYMKLTLIISSICKRMKMEDDSLYDGLKELVFAMYEASNFYNSTNPSQKDQKKQEEATYKLLTSNPPRHKKREFERGFCNLCNAITKYSSQYYRNKRDQIPLYIRDICIAMMDTETYRHSQYSEKDDYLSLKSDSVTLPEMELLNVTELEWNKDHTKCRKKIKQCKASLIKSALEVDPFRGCPFDKVTGYVSHYNKEPIPGTISPLVLTIHITNPGKWKTRAIHLAMSCIQDRCSYISNRIAAVLRKMKTDCTFDQSNGHRYNLRITHPQNRKGSWNVLAYDWSNATDKMLQDFQEKALSLLFPPEVVEFWHEISTCTKIFRFCDGSQREYVQSNGQPQGLLGSFPAFAFAHHLIMLLTMHMNGFQNIDSTLFYRVLGDDSLICSVKLDPHNYVGRYYRAICMWANMKINLKKSTEVMSWEDTCLVEFAKVNVLDGEFFSPIPFRLACRIADKKRDYYAFAAYIWEQRHGVDNKQIIKRLIDTYYPLEKENKIVNTLVFCGLLPAYTGVGFEEFSDHIVIDTFLLECLLAYWYVNIRTSFLMPLVKDHQIDDIRQYETAFDADPLLRLIPESMEGLLDLVEDPEHKIFRVIQSNLDKQEIIEQILKCSPDQSAIISSKVEITEEDIKAVQALVDLINQCKGNEEMVSYYQTDILDMANKMRSIRSFDIRSIYKSDTWNSRLLGKAVEAFNELFPEDN